MWNFDNRIGTYTTSKTCIVILTMFFDKFNWELTVILTELSCSLSRSALGSWGLMSFLNRNIKNMHSTGETSSTAVFMNLLFRTIRCFHIKTARDRRRIFENFKWTRITQHYSSELGIYCHALAITILSSTLIRFPVVFFSFQIKKTTTDATTTTRRRPTEHYYS